MTDLTFFNMHEETSQKLEISEDELWNIGLYDVHCHPTDRPESLSEIGSMKTAKLVIMSTSFSDIERVAQTAEIFVDKIVPAFGYHPWFSHLVYLGEKPSSKVEHYQNVLVPSPDSQWIEDQNLPEPKDFMVFIRLMEHYLDKFPHAIVGELGLDKSYKLPNHRKSELERRLSIHQSSITHQTAVFQAQLEVARKYSRPISVHCVKSHGILHDVIKKLPIEIICLHSYSGSPDFLYSWYRLQKDLNIKVFVSLSALINCTDDAKMKKLITSIPENRVLLESDFHRAGMQMDGFNMEILQRLSRVKQWSASDAATIIKKNFLEFITAMA